ILQYGNIDMPAYEKQWYRLGGAVSYKVDEHFPRLIKGNVPVQISEVGYEISLQAIEDWRIR
ncbi:MAG: PD-(D/E)XK motif protein, partial [Bacilli bacterium]